MARRGKTQAERLNSTGNEGATEPDLKPGPLALSWAAMTTRLYADGRIDITHESIVTQGATLSILLDRFPVAEDAPRWHSELRQVRRELMGNDEDEADDKAATAAQQVVAVLAQLGPNAG